MFKDKYSSMFSIFVIVFVFAIFYSVGGVDLIVESFKENKSTNEKEENELIEVKADTFESKDLKKILYKKCKIIKEIMEREAKSTNEVTLIEKNFKKIDLDSKSISLSKYTKFSDMGITVQPNSKAYLIDNYVYTDEDMGTKQFKYLVMTLNGYCGWVDEDLVKK